MSLKKVLIISYYWPPIGGSGVQRWLKFVKYLPEFGFQPFVYTPSNPEGSVLDESLLKDIPEEAVVLKTEIWEPYNIYKFLSGKKKEEKLYLGRIDENGKESILKKLAFWFRGNFLIPDPKVFWIKPSVKYLEEIIRKEKIELIISSGPPHSMHLIAKKLKQKLGVKWIADFRDPWTNIDFYKELHLNPISDFVHKKLEKSVLKIADLVLVVGNDMKQEAQSLGAKNVEVITNGFDDEVNENQNIKLDSEFTFAHIGTFSKNRNHPFLWKCMAEICTENQAFSNALKIRFVGPVDEDLKASLKENQLFSKTEFIAYLAHKEVIEFQKKSQVLFLSINNSNNAKGILTGKFFEYLVSGRPIFAIAPKDGDLAYILNETQAGEVVDFEDYQKCKSVLLDMFHKYEQNKLFNKASGINKFHRKSLTKNLVEALNKL